MSTFSKWFAKVQHMLLVEEPERRGRSETPRKKLLVVMTSIGGGVWTVGAVEGVEGELFLDNHAHKMIGDYPSRRKARRAAESFARAWLAGHKTARRGDKCACDDIDIPRQQKASSSTKGRVAA